MLNLFLLALSVSSFTINGYSSTLISHNDNSGTVMYYEFQGDDSDVTNGDTFTLGTSQGSISFQVLYNYQNLGNYHSYDLQFKVSGESAYSNLYLYNLEAEVNEDNMPTYTFALPNVYFLGQPNYYVDNEDGNYTIQYANTGRVSNIFIKFDIGLLPSSFVDGSTYQNGYTDGYNTGYSTGVDEGISQGYQTGFTDGLQEGTDRNATATTIFTGILQVGLLPVNVFLAIFNFEVFGINIGGFIASLMTIAIIVIVIRIIVGAKSGS